jgi:predicted HAD superfamily Cof-like phosphohydrolase
MREALEKLREFHLKHRFPVDIWPGDDPKTDLVRVHLIAEEGVAEFALAIANRDIVKMADALGDLAYVLFGAAVTYGIPLEEVFDEIHRSNMTKAVRQEGDTRLRNKGHGYRAPDIDGVLAQHMPRVKELLKEMENR